MSDNSSDGQKPQKIANKDIDIKLINDLNHLYETKKGSDVVMTAADKYALDQLKTICSEYLTSNMSPKNCIANLLHSKYMNDMNLKTKSLQCIKDNIRAVIEIIDWTTLMTKHTDLVNELLLFSIEIRPIEMTIRLVISGISDLESDKWSSIHYVHGLPWRIYAGPRLVKKESIDEKYLNFYLICKPLNEIQLSCNCLAEFKLISQLEGIDNYSRKFSKKYTYSNQYNSWGYEQFISWEQLVKPIEGFIKDDTIILEVLVTVDPPERLSDADKSD